jgi:hypothetical protein
MIRNSRRNQRKEPESANEHGSYLDNDHTPKLAISSVRFPPKAAASNVEQVGELD